MTRPLRLALAGGISATGLLALSLALSGARASQMRPALPTDPLQVLADVVMIEARCPALNVDYGKLFAFAERNGIRPIDIMPLGDRRAAFEAAYRRRAREAGDLDLCGSLAAERAAAVPGVFTAR